MLDQIRNAKLLTALKWKQGEARALATVSRVILDDFAVLFDIPPAGDYDHELERVPEATEHIKLFGPRLAKHCGSRTIFIDARLIDDERHREGFSRHPLAELIERGRLAGARPCPVTSLDRSDSYQAAVVAFATSHAPLPVCVRLDASQIESSALTLELERLLDRLGCDPERVLLAVDLGGRRLTEADAVPLAESLSERLNSLPYLHRWLNVAVLMTTFPEVIKLKAGQDHRYPRVEWSVFKALWGMGERLLRRPMFGDYALEYPGRYVVGQAQPVAQFRYTTADDYFVFKGQTTKKPNGYAVIREVAARLVAVPDYAGPTFSQGDAFLDRLNRRIGGPGNASTWRWAWTDHHLTSAWRQFRLLAGLSADVAPEVVPESEQLALIA